MSNAEKFPTTTVEQAPQKPEATVEDINFDDLDSADKNRFHAWIRHQGELPFDIFNETTKDMGEFAARITQSWEQASTSKEKSDVVLGSLATGLGEAVKLTGRVAPGAVAARLFGEKATDVYDKGLKAGIGAAVEHFVPDTADGTIGFRPEGFAEVVDLKGLGVEVAVAAVDGGVERADKYVQEELAENPDSVIANTLNAAGEFYDSKPGQFVKGKVVDIATKRISKAAASAPADSVRAA